jgi:hypothetical protein
VDAPVPGISRSLTRGVGFNPILDEVSVLGVEGVAQLLFESVRALVIQVFADGCEESSFKPKSM